jgi:hypothetical protein
MQSERPALFVNRADRDMNHPIEGIKDPVPRIASPHYRIAQQRAKQEPQRKIHD